MRDLGLPKRDAEAGAVRPLRALASALRLLPGGIVAGGILSGCLLIGCVLGPKLPDGLYAELDTSKGTVIFSLAYREAPLTVANFVGLAEGTIAPSKETGKRFYDGLVFHRVIPGFIVQSGDPTGTGSGGPGYTIPDEIVPAFKHDAPGVVAMANKGPNTNGSQFYITTGPAPWLDGHYSIFGHVVRGMDVVERIQKGDRIERVRILRVGADAEAYRVDQAAFDKLLADANERVREEEARKASDELAEVEKRWPRATALADGLRYVVEKRGVGARTPKPGSEVTVTYTGTLLDGTKFDSSAESGEPLTFVVGQAIEGMNEAVVLMKRGEECLVIVPPELGYGERGYPGRIPPDSYLLLDIELVDFK